MPTPPKILRRLDVSDTMIRGGRQRSHQHVEKVTKIDNVPLKQRVLDALRVANEREGEPEKAPEQNQRLHKDNLLDEFIETFKIISSGFNVEDYEIKTVFLGLQKRIQIRLNTRRGSVCFLVTDNKDNLAISMTSMLNNGKYTLREVEHAMRQGYGNIRGIRLNNLRMVGLTMSTSFIIDNEDDLFHDLNILVKPFV